MNQKKSSLLQIIALIAIQFILLFPKGLQAVNNISKASSTETGKSFYTTQLHDDKAIYLTPENFAVTPDKDGDDSDALQEAINKAEEKSVFGIVMIPEGKYQITKTIYVWKGIRLIGYGKNRPVFVLEKNTPGFQEGDGKYMIHFVSNKPREGRPISDANPPLLQYAHTLLSIVISLMLISILAKVKQELKKSVTKLMIAVLSMVNMV